MGYGINNVVGGFGRALSPEEAIPYALNRTYHEHRQLRGILNFHKRVSIHEVAALELGCGYGRNLPVLQEFADIVVGVERDQELRDIAAALNPTVPVNQASVDEYDQLPQAKYDIVLTFTFLQHLRDEEMRKACEYIRNHTNRGALIILCEETDRSKSHVGCWSRTPEQYAKELGDFTIIGVQNREIEPTFTGRVSGEFVVLRKIS